MNPYELFKNNRWSYLVKINVFCLLHAIEIFINFHNKKINPGHGPIIASYDFGYFMGVAN